MHKFLPSLLGALVFAALCSPTQAQLNTTPTYPELIGTYQELAQSHPTAARLLETGKTDAGLPLHVLVIDPSGKFDPAHSRQQGHLVTMVMNGIHPGEPCGINASITFAERLLDNPEEGMVYLIIPVYNVGGALNRSSTSRVNQVGPEEYGFRGNAKNYDLNRDFIKMDAANTSAFTSLFHAWRPHIFVDTHTTNGADYQAPITLIHSTPEKMQRMQGALLERETVPRLYRKMNERGYPMVPYVNTVSGTPESGIRSFDDLPRYSMGYTSLWNTLSFTTEAHMLKPFEVRVNATLAFLESLHEVAQGQKSTLLALRKSADEKVAETRTFTTSWELSGEVDSLLFAGYQVDSLTSAVTGLPRIRYNRDRPYEKKVPWFHAFEPAREFTLPASVIIPQGWTEVIERLAANGIEMETLQEDVTMDVQALYIESFESTETPYEGHALHRNTTYRKRPVTMHFRAGDVQVKCNQAGNRFLAHVLDPSGADSYFNWNLFDAVLRQKEYFSPYLFEETAEKLLKRNTSLAKAFQEKKKTDADFAANAWEQLYFIYTNSPHYEQSHKRLPYYFVE